MGLPGRRCFPLSCRNDWVGATVLDLCGSTLYLWRSEDFKFLFTREDVKEDTRERTGRSRRGLLLLCPYTTTLKGSYLFFRLTVVRPYLDEQNLHHNRYVPRVKESKFRKCEERLRNTRTGFPTLDGPTRQLSYSGRSVEAS